MHTYHQNSVYYKPGVGQATLITALLFSLQHIAQADTIDMKGQESWERCGYCHEYDGNSRMPGYPKLAGQNRLYLIKQLNDFKSGARKSVMQATAETLTDEEVKKVAEYFSQQKLIPNKDKSPKPNPAAVKLVRKGDAKRSLDACTSCHGEKLLGGGVIPRLAGQHAEYLKKTLLAFKTKERKNDEAQFMRDVVSRLTEQEITALADYLAGL